MEVVIVVVLVVLSVVGVVRSQMKNVGIGTPDGKIDCGCGTCESKPRRSKS